MLEEQTNLYFFKTFKWLSMQKSQCPIYQGTLKTFILSKMWKITALTAGVLIMWNIARFGSFLTFDNIFVKVSSFQNLPYYILKNRIANKKIYRFNTFSWHRFFLQGKNLPLCKKSKGLKKNFYHERKFIFED